jgi:hypothetical protein
MLVKTHFLLAGLTALVLMAAPVPAAEFILVRQGEPQARIVLADPDAAGPVHFAAQEFQRYVQAMGGASLPIVKAGASNESPAGGLREVHINAERTAEADSARATASVDRYRLEVSEKLITITGASPRAALFATYDLLERLGCGWCVPGDDTIPKRSTVSVAAVKVDTAPTFKYRIMLDYPLLSVAQSIAILDWIAKNRLNWVHPCPNAFGEPKDWYDRRDKLVPGLRNRGLRVNLGGHTMHTWVSPDYFKEHPEWFAYNDGERKPPTLCVSNTDMTAELVRNMRKFLDRCPEIDVVDIWHPDTNVYCHCPVCTKGLVPAEAKGKSSEGTGDAVKSAHAISYIEFMNRVAAEIAKSHPQVMISPLIYGATDRAMPDGCPAPADNMLLATAHIARDTYRPLAGEPKSAVNMRYLGHDLTWMAKAKNHYIYEYYNCWVEPFIYPGAQVIVQDLGILKHIGAQGASSDMWGYTPCNMYVAARAMWSPDISWQDAVRDFCTRYYGDVGPEMADNEIYLNKSLYGTNGYGSGGALSPPERQAESGRFLNEVRPKQIAFIEGLIARTSDPLIKVRLERAVKPWKLWSKEARWWAFPTFEDSK